MWTEEFVAGLDGQLVPLAAFALVAAGLGCLTAHCPSTAGSPTAALGALLAQKNRAECEENRHKRAAKKKKKSRRTDLRPGRVVPAARVAVSVAGFLVVGFVLPAAVAVVHLLGLSVGAADLGAVYFQGPVSQAALGCALALAGHVPPARNRAMHESGEVESRAKG